MSMLVQLIEPETSYVPTTVSAMVTEMMLGDSPRTAMMVVGAVMTAYDHNISLFMSED